MNYIQVVDDIDVIEQERFPQEEGYTVNLQHCLAV